MTAKKIIFVLLFFLGMILMGFNIFGLFRSLRNEALYSEITPYRDDISIRFEEAEIQLKRGENELDKDFAARATMLVNKSMAHYWKDEGTRKYFMRVPLWENYILSFRQWITGDKKYEFRDFKKAIERGVGLCSQPCIALKYLLEEYGIKADLWDLQQHVVVGVTFGDGTEYTLDPDYGYVIPVGMIGLQRNPRLVREAYRNHDDVYALHVTEHKRTEDIVRMYTQDGNRIYHMKRSFEDFSYYAKWMLPVLLILPCIWTLLTRKEA
jgi:hypothetical protein